jgi:hypothetical protein
MTDASQEQPGPGAVPLSVRIIANLEIFARTPLVLLGAFSAARHHSPAILLGLVIPFRVAALFFVPFNVGSFILAVGTLWKKPWGLDGLVAYSVFVLVNAPLVLLSGARLRYDAIQAQRFVVDSQISVETAMKIQQIISTSVYAVGFTISAVCLYFLLTRRGAFRVACATHAQVPR